MNEQATPVVETPTPAATPVAETPKVEVAATTETKATTKSSSGNKMLIIILLLLCCCITVVAGGAFVAVNLLNRGANIINNAISNEIVNSTGLGGILNSVTPNSDGTATITNEDGSSINFGTKLPAEFPSDVPIYSGATESISSSNINEDGKREVSATFAVEAKLTPIVDFYKSQLKSKGYTLVNEVGFFGATLSFENSKRNLTVSVLGSDEEASALLTILSVEK